MTTPSAKVYVKRTVCVMVLIPMVFLVLYPVMIMLLPVRVTILADLLQDFSLLLLLDVLVAPVAGAVLYLRAKRRAIDQASGVLRDEVNTRDVY